MSTPTEDAKNAIACRELYHAEIRKNTALLAEIKELKRTVARQKAALQSIADETQKHFEHNPVAKVDRLPRGYTKILNLADAAINT